MSTIYRPQGSEKITDPEKRLDRIKEIAGIGHKPILNENKNNTKFSTVLHEAVAADGTTYGLVQEGPKVYLKHLINDHYEYIGDEKNYAYKDFAQAFKHMNLLFKDINLKEGHDKSINIFEGGLNEKKNLTEQRFILKTPSGQPQPNQGVNPAPPAENMPAGEPIAPPANPEASQQLDQEFDNADDEQDPAKSMQKLTGKLTQKMREADDQVMTSEFMKAILNSVVSAVDTNKMEDADLLSVIKKLKGEDNPESVAPEGDANSSYTDDKGVDYNVNNPANPENQEQPLKEIGQTPEYLQQHTLPNNDAPTELSRGDTVLLLRPITTFRETFDKGLIGIVIGVNESDNTGWENAVWIKMQDGREVGWVGPKFLKKLNPITKPLYEEEEPTWDDQPMQGILSQVIQNMGIEVNEATENDIRNAVQYFVNSNDDDQNQTQFMQQMKDYLNETVPADPVKNTNMRFNDLSQMGKDLIIQLETIMPDAQTAEQGISPEKNNTTNFQTPTTPMMGMAAESKDFLKNIIIEALNYK